MSEEVRMCVILLFNIIWNVNIVIESSFRANVAFCHLSKSIADMYTYKFIIVINFFPCNNTSNKFSRNCNPSPLRILNHQTPFITCEISFYFNKNFKTWYLFTLCNDMYFNEPSLLLFTSNSPRKKNQNFKEMKGNEMKMNSKGSICDIFIIFICS